MKMQDTIQSSVTATLVPSDERMSALPAHFGGHMMLVEKAIYESLGEMCQSYKGGYWDFYALNNGGFYMAPATDQPFHLSVLGNGFEQSVSAEVAGIIASLVGINKALWATYAESLQHRFYELREYAMEHSDGAAIMAAID